MKIIHKILRIAQLLAALGLIALYFLYEHIWMFVAEHAPFLSFMNFADTIVFLIIGVVASVPVRYIVEKIVESKFML
jgi:small-conductance mechanosensitive channel